LGWSEGRNIRIEDRWTAGDNNRLRAYAAELAQLKPDVIVCEGTPVVVALQHNGYSRIGLQPCSILAPTNKLRLASLFDGGTISSISPRAPGCYRWRRALRSRRDQKAVNMSNIYKFSFREWLVPPVLLPIFFVLLVAAAMVIQW
jgi:hypothetical protein